MGQNRHPSRDILEYGIIAGILTAAVVSGFRLLGNNLSTKFVIAANHLT